MTSIQLARIHFPTFRWTSLCRYGMNVTMRVELAQYKLLIVLDVSHAAKAFGLLSGTNQPFQRALIKS